MESAIGFYKTELINNNKSWTGRADVERETAARVHCYNSTHLHSWLGYLSPITYEDHYRDTSPPPPEAA